MKLRLVKVVVLMLMAGLSGCSYRGSSDSFRPVWQAKDLRINVECYAKDHSCPSQMDVLVNGYDQMIPDPGRGPVKVEWLITTPRTAAEKALPWEEYKKLPLPESQKKTAIVSVRRVRYWNDAMKVVVAQKEGVAPNDPKFLAMIKTWFPDGLTHLAVLFFPNGKVRVEVNDTGAPWCLKQKNDFTDYCPQDGIEE